MRDSGIGEIFARHKGIPCLNAIIGKSALLHHRLDIFDSIGARADLPLWWGAPRWHRGIAISSGRASLPENGEL